MKSFKYNKELSWKENYFNYLKSEQWLEKKKLIYQRAGNRCEKLDQDGWRCRDNGSHVHHICYSSVFNEKPHHLRLLCRRHHEEEHGI